MSDLLGRIVGRKHDPAAEAASAQHERDLAQARRWPEYQSEQLEPLDDSPGWFVADGERILELVPPASDPTLHYVTGWVMVDGEPRYLRPPLNGPSSLALWQHNRSVAAREADQAARERARELAATPPRPVTIDLLEGRPLPTPRQALETFTRLNGELWLDGDGRLQAGWRGTALDSYSRPALVDAARVLFLCEPLVVEHLRNGTPLPDAAITPAGAVATPKPAAARKAS